MITDQSIIIASAWGQYYFDYFFEQKRSPFRVSAVLERKEDIQSLLSLVEGSGKKYFWYLIGHKYPSQEFLQFLHNNFKLIGKRQFTGSSFFLFQLE
jgi:hypothetical protein